MYAAARSIPVTKKSTLKRGIFPTLLAFCCFITLILLAIAIVVLALIPLYLPKKSVTVNEEGFKTKEITMYIAVEKNHAENIHRRKREEGDLYDITGGTFGQAGLDMIKSTYLSVLSQNHYVKDVSISNASVAYYETRRRRSFLVKRQLYPKKRIILIVKFFILFASECFYSCQSYNCPTLRQLLFTINAQHVVYVNVPINKNGVYFTLAPRIEFIEILYISTILPGLSPSTEDTSPATITLATTTTSTTALSMTPMLGG